jgi:molybdenum cofactor synthesis domain-containing protein
VSRTVVVITVSDSVSSGHRTDVSGPAVEQALVNLGFSVRRDLSSDDSDSVYALLMRHVADPAVCAIFTTGGTGLGPRDWTPEATRRVIDRELPGFGEWMRFRGRTSTVQAILSRGVAGSRGSTLVVNLPGSPKGAVESLDAIADVLSHAIDLLEGNTDHPGRAETPAEGITSQR